MTYKKILVPYDEGRAADRALEYALTLARSIGEVVIILHVIPEIPLPATMTGSRLHSIKTGEQVSPREYLKELYHEMKTDALAMLEEAKEKSQHVLSPERTADSKKQGSGPPHKVRIRTKVLLGRPQDRIVEFIREEGVDLVVIGNVCLKGISKVKALGSVSRDVAERSGCPVIIIH